MADTFVPYRSALVYKLFTKPRPKLHVHKIAGVGKDLHKQMYEKFAAGNLEPIQAKLCQGLLSSLKSRIGQRPPGVFLKWSIEDYISKPRLVSYKATIMPGSKGIVKSDRNGVIQAVVRLHTRQSLQHVKRISRRQGGGTSTQEVLVDVQGREIQQSEKDARKDAKELVEYVVVQKMIQKNKEGPWMIWGTTEEMTLDKLKRQEKVDSKQPPQTNSLLGRAFANVRARMPM